MGSLNHQTPTGKKISTIRLELYGDLHPLAALIWQYKWLHGSTPPFHAPRDLFPLTTEAPTYPPAESCDSGQYRHISPARPTQVQIRNNDCSVPASQPGQLRFRLITKFPSSKIYDDPEVDLIDDCHGTCTETLKPNDLCLDKQSPQRGHSNDSMSCFALKPQTSGVMTKNNISDTPVTPIITRCYAMKTNNAQFQVLMASHWAARDVLQTRAVKAFMFQRPAHFVDRCYIHVGCGSTKIADVAPI